MLTKRTYEKYLTAWAGIGGGAGFFICHESIPFYLLHIFLNGGVFLDKSFKFKLSNSANQNYSDAEALFRDLKSRDPKIQHLWSHQADIIRAYHQSLKETDIALELPTGAGKTLVGLLIAEWRRLNLNQRVIYLCPTRQLAKQVGARASEYGIKTHVLIGKQSKYNPAQFSDYASGKTIAITTYSALFNTNPRLDDAETIIFDDAHAGENYIANMWSLSISRKADKSLYDQVVQLYETELPDFLLATLKDDEANPRRKQSVDLLPGPKFYDKVAALSGLIDNYIEDEEESKALSYNWEMLNGKLKSCCCYFSWSEILIRPWIPPTLVHMPFAGAKQRIYMSATLGDGGELERIVGVKKIHRIPVPQGWDKQGTGRRLFLFPDRTFSPPDYEPWLSNFLESKERSLVLTPNGLTLKYFEEMLQLYGINHEIIYSKDIEETLDNFINKSDAILALTNRYDGIDLPGDTCRVLIVYGSPSSTNQQEKFLWNNLRLNIILNDRIRTRITQAVGRCTRNSTDYAVILMIGEELFDFCIKNENRGSLHPELWAEIEFGLDNSETTNIRNLGVLADIFLKRDLQWDEAEADIIHRRNTFTKSVPANTTALNGVVSLEVEYIYNMWKDDHGSALVKATDIVDKLSGDELAGYRALWNYFAGCAAYCLGKLSNQREFMQKSAERFKLASNSTSGISWFAKLSEEVRVIGPQEKVKSYFSSISIAEAINSYLVELGFVGKKFEKKMSSFISSINDDKAKKFDMALTDLGRILGFYSENPKGNGAPDSIWVLENSYIIIFECKSNETALSNGISIDTCRQAQGHKEWLKSSPLYIKDINILSIVASHKTTLDRDAKPHAKELFYLNIADIRRLSLKATTFLRTIRSKIPTISDTERINVIQKELAAVGLELSSIISLFTKTKLLDLNN